MKKILINSCACYGSNDIHECYCNKQPMKQVTAAEWLIEQLSPSISLQQKHIDRYKILAIEMEKNQIINTFKDAQVFKVMNDETRAEQYYNQLYGK
jgi:hypothetical protein